MMQPIYSINTGLKAPQVNAFASSRIRFGIKSDSGPLELPFRSRLADPADKVNYLMPKNTTHPHSQEVITAGDKIIATVSQQLASPPNTVAVARELLNRMEVPDDISFLTWQVPWGQDSSNDARYIQMATLPSAETDILQTALRQVNEDGSGELVTSQGYVQEKIFEVKDLVLRHVVRVLYQHATTTATPTQQDVDDLTEASLRLTRGYTWDNNNGPGNLEAVKLLAPLFYQSRFPLKPSHQAEIGFMLGMIGDHLTGYAELGALPDKIAVGQYICQQETSTTPSDAIDSNLRRMTGHLLQYAALRDRLNFAVRKGKSAAPLQDFDKKQMEAEQTKQQKAAYDLWKSVSPRTPNQIKIHNFHKQIMQQIQ